MSHPIQIEIQLTPKDYFDAMRAHLGTWKYFFFPVLGSLLVLFGIFHQFLKFDASTGLAYVAFGALIVFGLPFLIHRQLKRNKKFSRPYTMTASRDGIETRTIGGDARVKWSAYEQFVETPQMFLLYSTPQFFYLFPKRFFSSEQLDEFGRLVHSNVPPKRISKAKLIKRIVIWLVIWLVLIGFSVFLVRKTF